MKFLVTGGLGYIGSVFVETATKKGHECIVIDRDTSKKNLFAELKLEVVIADILQVDTVVQLIAKYKPDVVHHFAAISTVGGHPDSVFAENIIGTENLLTAIKNYAPKTGFIFASSCSVYGNSTEINNEKSPQNPISAYARSKSGCEKAINKSNAEFFIPTVILRYSNVGGATASNGEMREQETHLIPNLIGAALNNTTVTLFGKDLPTKDGSCIRDYVHVLDIVNAHLIASEQILETKYNAGQHFNLCAGKSHSNLEVVQEVSQASGKKIQLEFASFRKGDPFVVYLDNRKAREQLEFIPQHSSLKEIVDSTYQWLRTKRFSNL